MPVDEILNLISEEKICLTCENAMTLGRSMYFE